jgi:hypothetical protein
MKKSIVFIFLGIIFCLNLLLVFSLQEKSDNIDFNFFKIAIAEGEWDPPGQIEIEVECEEWIYGCFWCGEPNGWCHIVGVKQGCVDQYVCPTCTCTPEENCHPVVSC